MKLLADTNIILEVLLEQQRAEEARSLLAAVRKYDIFVTDFSFHSIGLLLFRRKKHQEFQSLLDDLVTRGGVQVVSLSINDMEDVVRFAEEYGLDFDDAYQYAAGERDDLTIVSFDGDFDRTPRGRRTPASILRSR